MNNEVKYYLKAILEKSMNDNQKIEQIIDTLVFRLPNHEFVIDFELAKNFGLNVINGSEQKLLWPVMRSWVQKYLKAASDHHIMDYYIPTESDSS